MDSSKGLFGTILGVAAAVLFVGYGIYKSAKDIVGTRARQKPPRTP
jgi:hypothetical protein